MAEALFNRLAAGHAVAESAGTVPSDGVNPVVVLAMKELGFDLAGRRPQVITQEQVDRADWVYTMGCAADESCPATFVPAEDWGLEDPHGRPLEEVRRIRDQVAERVRRLLEEMGLS
jgi:arsenate reductase